jgi:nucleoside-diphosphate-sugar epimerase
MKTIMVTGGAGFIGSAVIRHIIIDTQYKVVNVDKLGVSRDLIIRALEAEGVSGLTSGYANIHLLPMYQKKIAYSFLIE